MAELMSREESIVGPNDLILVTGASGFIGSAVVENLLKRGFRRLRVFVRPSSKLARLKQVIRTYPESQVELISGNLLSREDCMRAADGVSVIYHLAAGTGEKSFPTAFMDSVVTTRNLLDASIERAHLRRFVNISSFAVYTNRNTRRWRVLDESCAVETDVNRRGDAYCFAKVKQDELVAEYGRKFGIQYVIVRPGSVFGPGKAAITGRVGIGTFGIFLHLGGPNRIPFVYVDNCAELIALAGLKPGVDGEVFNAVDDDLPSSRQFLRQYKKHVRSFRSIYVPHALSYGLCYLWKRYSEWSEGQLPPAFSPGRWHTEWKRTRYSNEKAKTRLGWSPKVPMTEGMTRFFQGCREAGKRA
jgi:nucleoside-diphosphate-sugar epimerase